MKDIQQESTHSYVNIIFAPHWGTAFIILSAVISLVPMLIGFYLGFSVASDQVFAVYALISGVISDQILRMKFNIYLMISTKLKISFIWLWFLLCIYIFLANPLSN